VKPITVKQVLQDALALVRQGWIKGRAKKTRYGRVCYCASGAINAATPLNGGLNYEAHYAVKCAAGINYIQALYDWNDAPERTKADVISAFETAIATARV
jgi:hypothetical protein